MASAESFKRYRFSVPNADESVTEWIEAQSNLSFSIRVLIRDFIRVHGKVDATCAPVEQRGKVGRPSKEDIAAREAAKASAEYAPEPVVLPQPGYPMQSQMVQSPPVFSSPVPAPPQPVVPPVQPVVPAMLDVPQNETVPQMQQFQDPADLIG